jgi:hypothetical protein
LGKTHYAPPKNYNHKYYISTFGFLM